MSFLLNLGKGFIRSAVNQVGRDTGKVVSNSIYGNAHSTPIRGVCRAEDTFFDEYTDKEISADEFKTRLIEQGYKPRYITHGLLHHILSFGGLYVLSFIFANIPLIYWVLTIGLGLNKAVDIPHIIYVKKDAVPVYAKDRRCKGGYRIDGYTTQKVRYKMPATSRQKKINAVLSAIYLMLCCTVSYYAVSAGENFYHYVNLSDHEQIVKDSAKTMTDINWWKDQDTAVYNRKVQEFNRKYQEAIEYINSSNKSEGKE